MADVARPAHRKAGGGAQAISAEVIQQAATILFAERTYPAVGIRDIADAVGLLPGSLYVHIRSKEDLLHVIVREGIQRYIDAIAPVGQGDGWPGERLQGAVAAYLRIAADHRASTRVAFHQWTYLQGDQRDGVVAQRQSYEQLFTDIVADGIAIGDFRQPRSRRLAVLTIVGALNAAGEWFDPAGPMDVEDVASDLTDIVLRGLTPPATGGRTLQ